MRAGVRIDAYGAGPLRTHVCASGACPRPRARVCAGRGSASRSPSTDSSRESLLDSLRVYEIESRVS
eukprot:6212736-Pleurochrysis_carterae.AAC.1